MDQVTSYRVFVAIVENNSFAAAADSLGMSRGMVSKHLAELEQRIGGRLLNRTTRRIALTEVGRRFHEDCSAILTQMEEAEHRAAQLHVRPRGTLKVNAPYSFGVAHIGPAIPAYLDRFPDVTVDLTLNDRFVDLLDEGVDVAVRIGQLGDSTLIARRLAETALVCCAAPAYLEQHPLIATPADLTDHNCLCYTYANEGQVWRFHGPDGEPHAVRVRGNLHANNGDVLLAAALQGLGVALSPAFIAAPHLDAGRLRAVMPGVTGLPLAIHALFPQGRQVSAKVRTFVDFLAERFAAPGNSFLPHP
ncbi:MAG: LysR family transcriptional regulator [Alphaproteobacteria bacterium]